MLIEAVILGLCAALWLWGGIGHTWRMRRLWLELDSFELPLPYEAYQAQVGRVGRRSNELWQRLVLIGSIIFAVLAFSIPSGLVSSGVLLFVPVLVLLGVPGLFYSHRIRHRLGCIELAEADEEQAYLVLQDARRQARPVSSRIRRRARAFEARHFRMLSLAASEEAEGAVSTPDARTKGDLTSSDGD